MPWSSEQKEKSREKILDSAVDLFSRRGFDNVAIGDLMQAAGMTHGGFYAHFGSKSELYKQAVTQAARRSAVSKLPEETLSAEDRLAKLLAGYLDISHVQQTNPPCPLAFLATDVANREGDVRSAYTQVFRRLVALISRQLPIESGSRRETALALSAMMIGGVAVARALNDDRSVEQLLDACRKAGLQMIEKTAGKKMPRP
ncbi:MAG: TetR/AcrR family transcriptional regulator [endosymbiont of Seepiophila jonesi]|uniref:TetR/AcrR family transcriptional regulator n=1 Tax=endosymbiont of Lamellibrachia luymesi TaxID=2200907 RepID=A0A370DQ23_9GAMM|nr:MAG: TetR/AcrR family transcriptional regulator [endosymbiont of Lamellibrachia luymesi]RDH92200.1 MAG: TetR/AcrR family transcriptional regulator [endosymbiont of Seepiophila jonesi]